MSTKKEPVAWMRRWAFEKEKPYQELSPTGRMRVPVRFKLHMVTIHKILADDVPLYAGEEK